MDVPAWFGRDLQVFRKVLKALLPSTPEPRSLSKQSMEIIYPTDFQPEESPEQVAAMEGFIKDLASATGATFRHVSIQEDWQKSTTVEEKGL